MFLVIFYYRFALCLKRSNHFESTIYGIDRIRYRRGILWNGETANRAHCAHIELRMRTRAQTADKIAHNIIELPVDLCSGWLCR